MQTSCRNIYREARVSAGITRIMAAVQLKVSESSLKAYERGITILSDDIVLAMIVLYNAPWLSFEHLRQTSQVAANWVPFVPRRTFSSSVLDLQVEMHDVADIERGIAEIVRDNSVRREELTKWQLCEKEINDMIGAGLAVIIAARQKGKQPCSEGR